jgi:RNA polymerase sigma factor (TIGR02999 family)
MLGELADGHPSAADRLLPLVYENLRRLAQSFLQAERAGHTLQATALVHEAYLKLVGQRESQLTGRAHFFAVAATAMRRILVDHARAHASDKRGGGIGLVSLDASAVVGAQPDAQLVALDEALTSLGELDPRQARIVECFYFGGMTVPEISEVVGVSRRTVDSELAHARAWFRQRLGEP